MLHTPAAPDEAMMEILCEDIERRHAAGEYRPCVVLILEDRDGCILMTQSAKNAVFRGFIQGGVDRGEHPLVALGREAAEEAGIDPLAYTVRSLCHIDQLEIPGMNRDGFTVGKCYYHFHATCSARPDISLNPEELSEYHWIKRDDAARFIKDVPNEKRQSLLAALGKIGKHVA